MHKTYLKSSLVKRIEMFCLNNNINNNNNNVIDNDNDNNNAGT